MSGGEGRTGASPRGQAGSPARAAARGAAAQGKERVESNEEQIERLLREGLNHYGMGQIAQALDCWRKVLALDPGHADARDYVETAAGAEQSAHPLERRAPAPPPAAASPARSAPPPASALDALVEDAKRLVKEGEFESALDLFDAVARRDPSRLELQGYVELVRSRLLQRYRERLGDLTSVLRLRLTPEETMKFNLPAHAGFVLSLIDGATSAADVLSVSGMESFEVLRMLNGLLDAGIVSVER